MLTSFFGNSKPVHYLILGAFISVGFVWTLFFEFPDVIAIGTLLFYALLIGVTIFGVILLDFIVNKNNLTLSNAYAIFFYTSFIGMLPIVFLNSNILLANLFLLLALRRIISLRKESNSEVKILDAAVWITVASLFYFWSLLFFLPLWIAIIQKPNLTFKQILIPLTGFLAVLTINTAYQLLVHNTITWFYGGKKPLGLEFSAYNSVNILIPATLLLTLLIFSLLYRWRSLPSISLKEKSNTLVFFIVLFTTLAIAICSPDKDGSELMFLFVPTAILCANYIEGSEQPKYEKIDSIEAWFREILLWTVSLFAVIFLFV